MKPTELEKLYKEDFTPTIKEDGNPYLVDFNKRLSEIDKKTVNEFAKILELYKSRFIEQSMQIFPITEAEQNYRNGVVIEVSKLIRTIQEYGVEKADPVFRDRGTLRSELEKANSKIIS